LEQTTGLTNHRDDDAYIRGASSPWAHLHLMGRPYRLPASDTPDWSGADLLRKQFVENFTIQGRLTI